MTSTPPGGRDASFRFEYDAPTIRFGAGAADDLAAELERRGRERALVVCGSTVGSTADVIEPVEEGLGDRLADVFAETTPEKRLGTALAGRDRLEEVDADVLVSLGGGSSLDVAKAIGTLAASGRSAADAGAEFADRGTLSVPGTGLVPIVAIPTTLAGADLSMGAGLTAAPETCPVDEPRSGGLSDPGLMPAAAVYDPDLVATTPESVLAGSAMNGFDKGLETVYAANATPVTDATAARGLERFHEGLLAYGRGERGTPTYEAILEGLVLVQYGVSRPGESTLSLVHAFGHALSGPYALQQGVAHAVVVPHVLAYLFDADGVDARLDLLADALGVADAADPATATVDVVTEVRDALGLPSRLRAVGGPEPDEFTAVAEATLADRFADNVPPGLEPTVAEIEGVLEAAW